MSVGCREAAIHPADGSNHEWAEPRVWVGRRLCPGPPFLLVNVANLIGPEPLDPFERVVQAVHTIGAQHALLFQTF